MKDYFDEKAKYEKIEAKKWINIEKQLLSWEKKAIGDNNLDIMNLLKELLKAVAIKDIDLLHGMKTEFEIIHKWLLGRY